MLRRLFALWSIGVLMGAVQAAAQDSYPNRPIRWVVPFPPGGPTDTLSRILAAKLGDDYLETYVQKVFSVTPEQVQQMASKYILSDKLTIVLVGDKAKIADQIAPYQNSNAGGN